MAPASALDTAAPGAPTNSSANSSATPAPPFPTAALGPLLGAAVTAVAAQTQAPEELVAHHVLALAAMAAQRLVGVRLPTGAPRPVSCFFATLVGPGEGADTAEKMLVDTVRTWERGFDAGMRRPEPLRHLDLFYSARAPQPEDRYRGYGRQTGFFVRHPHDLFQPGRLRRKEAASLCAIWNGKVIHQAVGPTFFPRLSVHLVAPPRAGRALLGETELAESGLLGRMLVAAPASRVGARTFMLSNSDDPPLAFQTLLGALGALYEKHPSTDFRIVAFTNDAAAVWLAYVQEVEAAMAPGADFAALRAFAGHLPEHAARLAVLVAFMEDGALGEITARHLEQGLALARYYAQVRLSLLGASAPELSEGEKEDILCAWLQRSCAEKDITLRDICRTGPRGMRDVDTAYKLMRRMERLGVVQPANDAFQGTSAPRRSGRRYAWKVEKNGGDSAA